MRNHWGIVVVFAVTASVTCADESALSKEEARELAFAGQLETDVCGSNGWYEDGTCDDFCVEFDEDCAAVSDADDNEDIDEDEDVDESPGDAGVDESLDDAGVDDAGVDDAGVEDEDDSDSDNEPDEDGDDGDDGESDEPVGALGVACGVNADCSQGLFCKLGDDALIAGALGFCATVPEQCVTTYAPVCGADGLTYDNECYANQSGINVVATTSCEKAQTDDPCGGPDDLPCADGQYCDQGGELMPIDGEGCLAIGVCKPSPAICAELHAPVCGCDGMTYLNQCMAWQAGTDLLHHGPCETE